MAKSKSKKAKKKSTKGTQSDITTAAMAYFYDQLGYKGD